MSRNVQELKDKIGVDLLRRGPRGVSLTAEGLLKRADESVERVRVRALARGEYGELQVGYSAGRCSLATPWADLVAAP